MAYKEEKIEQFNRALKSLEALIHEKKTSIIRDASIQRFEYSVETFWKTLKIYLREYKGIDAPTPKDAVRKARGADILSEEDAVLALTMIDDRNETSHLYNEKLADALYIKLPRYAEFMRAIHARLVA